GDGTGGRGREGAAAAPVAVGGGELARTIGELGGGNADTGWLQHQGFSAQPGQSLVLRAAAGPPSIVLLGLGRPGSVDAERWRRAGAALVRAAGEGGTAAVLVPAEALGARADGPGAAAVGATAVGAALAEGAVLAAYRFDGYRSTRRSRTVDRVVVVGAGDELGAGVRRGARAALAAALARDLINTPPSDLTPAVLADRVAELLAGRDRTTVEVWDEDRIAAERLGGLLGVSRGSAQPPRFVRATYEPPSGAPDAAHVVLVGKGITFDSGGLSLKSAEGMTTMKTDMSGAAIVLAALSACADLAVPIRVTALAPITENMPGGGALKPGDVLTARNGSTIEVLNTDAEGRLVLADALSMAAELAPDAIVDVATLTGAATVALGTGMGALFGNDDHLVERVRAAGARSGERLWPMPLPDDYGEHIDSDVADMKNVGRPGQAGAIAAAMLLARFVGAVPWAHLDIAGTGRSTENSGYLSKGGTGFGVRTLLAFLEGNVSAPGTAPGTAT
ncbi:MAG: leucyl aminopeptidase, partial [Acidimicrobiales bacterium]